MQNLPVKIPTLIREPLQYFGLIIVAVLTILLALLSVANGVSLLSQNHSAFSNNTARYALYFGGTAWMVAVAIGLRIFCGKRGLVDDVSWLPVLASPASTALIAIVLRVASVSI